MSLKNQESVTERLKRIQETLSDIDQNTGMKMTSDDMRLLRSIGIQVYFMEGDRDEFG